MTGDDYDIATKVAANLLRLKGKLKTHVSPLASLTI